MANPTALTAIYGIHALGFYWDTVDLAWAAVTTNGFSGPTFGAALPSTGVALGANKTSDGTFQSLQVSDAGGLKVDVTEYAAGTQSVIFAYPTAPATTQTIFSQSTAGDKNVVTGTAAMKVKVWGAMLTVAAAVTLTWKTSTSHTAISGAYALPSAGVWTLDFRGEPWATTSTADNLELNLSGNVAVAGDIWTTTS